MGAGSWIAVFAAIALLIHTFAVIAVRYELIMKDENEDEDTVVKIYGLELKDVWMWVVSGGTGVLGLLLLGVAIMNSG